MLNHLHIHNYALIAQLDIHFQTGFTTITGETGAGKSIILDALALLLGGRTDLSVLKDKTQKCIVEATFSLEGYSLENFFQMHEWDYQAQTVVRREISPQGKSRAFVNDSPVNLSALKELGEVLIEIHTQHQTLELTKTPFQFEVIDYYAKNIALRQEYQGDFLQFQKNQQVLAELLETQAGQNKEKEYQDYLLAELEKAEFQTGELPRLEEKEKEWSAAEDHKVLLCKTLLLFESGNQGILDQLQQVVQHTAKIRMNHIDELRPRLHSLFLELKDLHEELENAQAEVHFEPQELHVLRERISLYYQLMKKHQVSSGDELLLLREKMATQLEAFSSLEERIAALQKTIQVQAKSLQEMAETLHHSRIAASVSFEEKIKTLLDKMAMPNALLQVNIQKKDSLDKWGISQLQFLLKANKGSDFQMLEKVASGGELSRVMLAIKCIFANYKKLPTLILDEIDTGVSGEIASNMAKIMQHLGKSMQVMAITHLPQVAAKGSQHLYVYKQDDRDQTFTHIHYVEGENRLEIIAKMLSGEKLSSAALVNAKELLSGI